MGVTAAGRGVGERNGRNPNFLVLVFGKSPVRARQLEVYKGMKRAVAIAAIMLFVPCLARAQGVARLAQPPDLMVSVWYNGGKARAPMLSPIGLLNWAKVSLPFTTSQDGVDSEKPLEARLHRNSGGYLLYLINHGEAERPVSVNLNVEREGEFTLSEILNKLTTRKRSDGNALTFSSQIPAKQAQVWDIRAY